MSKTKIFISRRVKKNSFSTNLADRFYKKIKELDAELHDESLLSFRQVSFDKIPHTDWIFFYSQKGVQFFFKNIRKKNLRVNRNIRFAGFGKATAKAIESQGYHCEFVGTGKAKTTAFDFLKIAKHQTVLFPRAKKSQQSVQRLISDKDLKMLDLVVYDNFSKKNIQLPEFDILIFTSPMNVETYFSIYKIKNKQRFLAIGKTTAAALKKAGVKEILISKESSLEGIVKLLLESEF